MKERATQKSRRRCARATGAALCLLAAWTCRQQPARPDLARTPSLYVVATAHLDSQWHWTYPETIGEFLPRTLRANFSLFKKYPHYIFNFSGANRYRFIREYYPREYSALKEHVAAGRWFPAGSSWEECDANIPSPESIIRQVLYGNLFFHREFGKRSAEFMLPDSFGFPASLPSILSHCGIKGFSTQKLYMGSGVAAGGPGSAQQSPTGIPFNVGFWEGLDGSGVIAALNPGPYNGTLWYDLSRSPGPAEAAVAGAAVDWPERIRRNGETGGIYADYMYYGRGDQGGAPPEASIRLLDAIVAKAVTVLPPLPRRLAGRLPRERREVRVGTGPLRVISASAEQMFLDIKPTQAALLPRYRGELQLTRHTAGSLTSQAYVKRWNRRGEVLADAAEKASVAAACLAGRRYPQSRLNQAWALVLGAQFHDILAGTSSPQAYRYAWNDQLLAMNQFSQVLASALEAIAAGLDTRAEGLAVVVYNSLEYERQDVVEVDLEFPGGPAAAVRVFGPEGDEVPAQVNSDRKILFLARLPALGLAVFDVRAVPAAAAPRSGPLRVKRGELENERYRVRIGDDGNVAGIFDKSSSRELLSAPLHMEIKADQPQEWPAWNMDWQDQRRQPLSRLEGPATLKVIENGPVRVAVEIERQAMGSRFVQVVRLAAGDAGNRLEFANRVDWHSRAAHLKAVFPLRAANPRATYNLGVGTLERGNNHERRYEVSAQQWFDLSDAGGAHGVTVLADCKYASDKPDDRTLRLTLIRTPGTRNFFPDQATQDLGRHEFVFGLAAHAGSWRRSRTDRHAYRLNQPLMAFLSQKHPGTRGKAFSFIRLSDDRVRVQALKKAEQGPATIVRLVECDGAEISRLGVRFASRIVSAREVNGQEAPLAPARIRDGELWTDLRPYQLRSFALEFAPAAEGVSGLRAREIPLEHDARVAGRNGEKVVGGLDGRGGVFPAEFLPGSISWRGVDLALVDPGNGGANAMRCRGQVLRLPEKGAGRLFLVAAADQDRKATFAVGGLAQELLIQGWQGFIGQWHDRQWRIPAETGPGAGAADGARRGTAERRPAVFSGLRAGFIKPGAVACFASHRHDARGADMPYAYAYLFAYELRVPPGAATVRLPDEKNICLLAMTAVDRDISLRPLLSPRDELPGEESAPGKKSLK